MFGSLNKQAITVECLAVKTGNALKYVSFPSRVRVTGVTLVSDAAQASHADNRFDLTITNLEDGNDGSGVVASHSTYGDAYAANVANTATVGATEALKRVEAGEVLSVALDEAGTATNDANVIVTIEYQNV